MENDNLFTPDVNKENSVGLVVDEAADLPKEIIEKYKMEVVPLKMDWPDVENLPGKNTFQKMREAGERGIKSFGKTSQPSPKDFLEAFKKQLRRFNEVICVTITSKLSGTYNSAIQAKNFLPAGRERIFVVDSLNGAGGEGLLVLKIIDLIKEKKRVEEIVKEAKRFIPQIHLRAMFEDVKWLEASGRISGIITNLLKKMQKIGIRPMIGIRKGVIVPISIKTRVKNISGALFGEFKGKARKFQEQGEKVRVAIVHGDNLKEAEKLKRMIESDFKDVEIAFINLIDDVLGIIAGPGSIVLAWVSIG